MIQNNYKVIGVMSGTSLDGVDLTYAHFYRENNSWKFKIIKVVTYSYDNNWQEKLNNAFHFKEKDLVFLNIEYTEFLANQILRFIDEFSIIDIDVICSHGHTVLHQPENGLTLQIGNLSLLSKLLQQIVVCDFRVQDVRLGGQGAPLVPIGDELLFSNYDYCLNLGGFSNVSFNENKNRIAFDICPVNIVLNYYAEKIGFPFDYGGKIAQSGSLSYDLLHKLNTIPFYQKSYPKSLGKEFVETEVLPLLKKYNLPDKDILRTLIEHIATQITNNIKDKTSILTTGGGAYNTFLINRLKMLHPTVNWIIPDDKLIQFKEALIFGLLGVLRLRNEINVLATVTGAKQNHSSGKIYYFK